MSNGPSQVLVNAMFPYTTRFHDDYSLVKSLPVTVGFNHYVECIIRIVMHTRKNV